MTKFLGWSFFSKIFFLNFTLFHDFFQLFLHAADVAKEFGGKIGAFDEEASEAIHKDMRDTRNNHTRKNSPEATMTDLFVGINMQSNIKTNLKAKTGKKKRHAGLDLEYLYGGYFKSSKFKKVFLNVFFKSITSASLFDSQFPLALPSH